MYHFPVMGGPSSSPLRCRRGAAGFISAVYATTKNSQKCVYISFAATFLPYAAQTCPNREAWGEKHLFSLSSSDSISVSISISFSFSFSFSPFHASLLLLFLPQSVCCCWNVSLFPLSRFVSFPMSVPTYLFSSFLP